MASAQIVMELQPERSRWLVEVEVGFPRCRRQTIFVPAGEDPFAAAAAVYYEFEPAAKPKPPEPPKPAANVAPAPPGPRPVPAPAKPAAAG